MGRTQIWDGTLHKFNKKDIRENPCDSWFFNQPQIITNYHKFSRINLVSNL